MTCCLLVDAGGVALLALGVLFLIDACGVTLLARGVLFLVDAGGIDNNDFLPH